MERWELGAAVEREIDGLWFPAVLVEAAPEGLVVRYPEGHVELIADLEELRTPRTDTAHPATCTPEVAEAKVASPSHDETQGHADSYHTVPGQIPQPSNQNPSEALPGLTGLQASLQKRLEGLNRVQQDLQSTSKHTLQPVRESLESCLDDYATLIDKALAGVDSDAVTAELVDSPNCINAIPSSHLVRQEVAGDARELVVLVEPQVRLRAGVGLGTGQQQWFAGIVLCQWLHSSNCSVQIQGATILELGSGLGLCGIVCAHLGAKQVFCTDVSQMLPLLSENVAENCRKHDVCQPSVHELVWGRTNQPLSDRVDLIVCCETLYNPGAHQDLLYTLKVNASMSTCTVLFCYDPRNDEPEQRFFMELQALGFVLQEASGVDTLGLDRVRICTATKSARDTLVVPAPGSIVPLVCAPHDMVVPYLIKLCGLGPEHCVLDLGCGEGDVLIHTALECGASIRGIDIQPEYISAAGTRSQQAGIAHLADFMVGDFNSINVTTSFVQDATVLYLFLLPTALEILGSLIKDCIALKKSVVTFQYHLDESLDIEVRKEELMGMMRLY